MLQQTAIHFEKMQRSSVVLRHTQRQAYGVFRHYVHIARFTTARAALDYYNFKSTPHALVVDSYATETTWY